MARGFPIVTDNEKVFLAVINEYLPQSTRFFCWNHVINSANYGLDDMVQLLLKYQPHETCFIKFMVDYLYGRLLCKMIYW